MKLKFIALAGVAISLLSVHAAGGQQVRKAVQHPGYLGIRYEETVQSGPGGTQVSIVVREVSAESPSEKAGLKPNDEIVRINGMLVANGEFHAIAGALVEGDTVRLVVRREGKERDVTIIAGARPDFLALAPFRRSIVIAPDSVRRLMLRYLDSARVHLDSLHLPGIRITPDDSMITVQVLPFKHMTTDSLLMNHDSVVTRIFRTRPGEPLLLPRAEIFERGAGPDVVFRSMELGARAIGGAELTELDPGMRDYFKTDAGVLVLRVLPETPAERAGLLPGDVIVKAKDRAVRSVAALRSIISNTSDNVKLEVIRKGDRKTVELKKR